MIDLGRLVAALRRCGTIVAFALLSSAAQAKDAELCDGERVAEYRHMCAAYTAFCSAFLADPETLDRSSLSPLPGKARRDFAFPKLHSDTLGFLKTPHSRISVVYYDNTPACELLMVGVSYADFSNGYRVWKQGTGKDFATRSSIEPKSAKRMDHAFAAVFLAGQRDDGRVTELTMNWNLSKGLTRVKVAYMRPREHTRKLLSMEKN
ncbi:hypothetical protein [Sulfitobacter sp. SK012]|uniref:hypothetical protein n=1 Tax=Sulfitobacter sp. SK012 TaxID=1389005 RepID=UPI0013B3F3EA|nr:hypothetical protein [Sulfitobacter sp. SK012]